MSHLPLPAGMESRDQQRGSPTRFLVLPEESCLEGGRRDEIGADSQRPHRGRAHSRGLSRSQEQDEAWKGLTGRPCWAGSSGQRRMG